MAGLARRPAEVRVAVRHEAVGEAEDAVPPCRATRVSRAGRRACASTCRRRPCRRSAWLFSACVLVVRSSRSTPSYPSRTGPWCFFGVLDPPVKLWWPTSDLLSTSGLRETLGAEPSRPQCRLSIDTVEGLEKTSVLHAASYHQKRCMAPRRCVQRMTVLGIEISQQQRRKQSSTMS